MKPDYVRFVKPALFVLFLLYLFSLYNRVPDVDDAWIGEHAYWFSEKGYVKSELMHGITLQHVRHIVHHKFFTLNGYLAIKAFGFSLYSLKTVSLAWSLIFSFIFFHYLLKKFGRETAWTGILLLWINAFIFQYSFVYRPEIVVMTLGFVSFICVERYLEKPNKWLILIAGVTAGLAATTHLNGLIFIGAGSLVLLWKKKPLAGIGLVICSLAGFSLYFYDFTPEYGAEFWLYQIKGSPALHKSTVIPSSIAYFLKILREHLRFFHSPKEVAMSILLIFSVIVSFKYLKNKTIYLHYLILLIILLSIITAHTTTKYLILHIPYIMIAILIAFNAAVNGTLSGKVLKMNAKQQTKAFYILMMIFILVHLTFNVIISTQKFEPATYAEITEKYFSKDTGHTKVIAPMVFVFNELPKYERIHSDLSILDLQPDKKISNQKFIKLIDSLKIDGMILTDEYLEKFGINVTGVTNLREHGFNIVGNETGLTIIKKSNQEYVAKRKEEK